MEGYCDDKCRGSARLLYTKKTQNKQGERGVKMQNETSVTSQVFFLFSSVNKDRQDTGDQGIHVLVE